MEQENVLHVGVVVIVRIAMVREFKRVPTGHAKSVAARVHVKPATGRKNAISVKVRALNDGDRRTHLSIF